jgi:hypothetical protein
VDWKGAFREADRILDPFSPLSKGSIHTNISPARAAAHIGAAIGKPVEIVADMVESLFAPVQTPERAALAEQSRLDREYQAERSVHEREGRER